MCVCHMGNSCCEPGMGSQEASVGYPALKATGLTVNRSTGKAAPECLVGMDVIDLQCQSSGPTPHNETKRERPQSSVVGRDSAWMACGGALSILGGAPNVLMAYLWPQVVLLQPGQRAMVLAAIDGLFCLSASAVLVLGSLYGVQRYGKHTQPYPGPFREGTGKVSPFLVKYYMRLVVSLGAFVPVCAMAVLAWQGQASLGFCTLGVYVLQLFAQIKSEGVYLRKGSIMWPQVPQLYQTYRLWQLMRGCVLTRALNGPDWLWGMQAFLLLMWYFNYAAVCTWMPWLYRWQLQPASEGKSSEKNQ